MSIPELSPIQYPLDFPIKVMGKNDPSFAQLVVAIVHLETRGGSVVGLRVNRDPKRIAYLGVPLN